MINLNEKIKGLVYSSHKPNSIVYDEDNLFEYEDIRQTIEEDGYIIINAESSLDVRLKYELTIKNRDEKYLIVIPSNYQLLPDLMQNIYYRHLNLKKIFPNLDSGVIKGLSYNALCMLYSIKLYEELGYEKTIKFLLENLYAVNLDTLKSNKPKERLLSALIVVFLGKNHINLTIAEYLTKLAVPYFPELSSSILNRGRLLLFLNEKWLKFINNNDTYIDFEELILSKSMAHLFVFELMKPLKITQDRFESVSKQLRIGVFINEMEDNDRELSSLIEYCFEQQQIIEDSYEEWFSIIQVLAKAKIKELQTGDTCLKSQFAEIETKLNERFQRFIDNTYSSLFSLSGIKKPVLVTRILDYIKAQPNSKKALVVIDGMNFWQGLMLRNVLSANGMTVDTKTTMAFIPSITAWSRQAIFRGDRPALNEDNSQEELLFREYWKKNNYNPIGINFIKINLSKLYITPEIGTFTNILGIVCNDLDDVMHGIVLGNDQLKSSTEQWIKDNKVAELVNTLRSYGFKIFITSDHGNVQATGIKNLRINEKVGALSRSRRHLHFSNKEMLSNFLEQNPNLDIGIRDNSVYLKNDDAFITEGTKIVTHGGSHLWEILIPFMEIE